MTKMTLFLSAAFAAAPALADTQTFPARSHLMSLAGGEMPEVAPIKETAAAAPRIDCSMDVDFQLTGKGLLIFKVWGEYRATAVVTCRGAKAEYVITGEGPSVGLQIPGRGNPFQSVVKGKSVGINLRLPVDGTPERLEGEYFGGGVSTAVGGVMLSPFTNQNGQLDVKLSLPTGLKDDQGTLVSIDIQHLTMRLKK